MLKIVRTLLVLACIGTFISKHVVVQTGAQIQGIEHIALQYHDGILTLYRIDTVGNFSPLTSLPNIGLLNLAPDINQITQPDNIALSPDGHYIVFTAISSTASTLYVYTPETDTFHEILIPGLAQPIWSPASDALLLVPISASMGAERESDDVYLYVPASDELKKIITTTPSSFLGTVKWLPDNEHIVFNKNGELYLINRSDWNEIQLSNLQSFHPGLSCWNHSPIWLEHNQRLYFAANCYDPGGELAHDSLHSVDLKGIDQVEINLATNYPQDIFSKIVHTFADPVTSSIYLVVTSETDQRQQHGQWPLIWRLLRLSSSGQWRLIAEFLLYDLDVRPTYTIAVSPDKQMLALGGHIWDGHQTSGYLAVISLRTSRVTEWRTDHSICEIQWLDGANLLYNEFEGVCDNDYKEPKDIWKLNTETGFKTDISVGLDGLVWLLPTVSN